ncbi:MAG: hypothetical protein R3F41_02695 [Gammaproteobacteria bacterium]
MRTFVPILLVMGWYFPALLAWTSDIPGCEDNASAIRSRLRPLVL